MNMNAKERDKIRAQAKSIAVGIAAMDERIEELEVELRRANAEAERLYGLLKDMQEGTDGT